jgi:hypothetical protein
VDDEYIEAFKHLNALKAEFKATVVGLPAGTSKSGLGCSLLQAYRKVLLIENELSDISFTWAAGNTSVVKITTQKLRQRVADRFLGGDQTIQFDDSIQEGSLENSGVAMLAILAPIPDTEILAIKKPVKPHVKVNIREAGETSWVSKDGSLPVVIPSSVWSDETVIVHLPDSVEMSRKRAPRVSVYTDTPLITKLNCYRYKRPKHVS